MLISSLSAVITTLPCSGGHCAAAWQHAGPAGYHGLDKSDDDPSLILSAGAAQA